MKQSLFLIPLLMISLVSCNPFNKNKDDQEPYPAKLVLRTSDFTYNQHSNASPHRDPMLVDIFLNGSATPAKASELSGGNVEAGRRFGYYLAIEVRDDLYDVIGMTPSTTIDKSFDVGDVLDGSSLVTTGGLMLEAKTPNTQKYVDRISLTLYRIDETPEDGFRFAQVSETVDFEVQTLHAEPTLRMEFVEEIVRSQYLLADGSDSFSFTITDLALDKNPLGPVNRERFILAHTFTEMTRAQDVTDQFIFNEELLPNGDIKVTVRANGAPVDINYRLSIAPTLDDAPEVISTEINFSIVVE